jgi:diguanylate cyclase (GGDEF)-like protein/PAS domain S-box-containing protein
MSTEPKVPAGDGPPAGHAPAAHGTTSIQELLQAMQRIAGEIIGRVWTFRDVTERMRMQAALLASEQRYRRLFEESRHALYITTHDGDFVDVNDAMLDLFGYAREDMLSLNAAALYSQPGDRAEFQRLIVEAGSLRNHEVRLRDREGRPLDCLVSARARRSPDGTAMGYEGIIEDVTERKRVLEALRQSERHFRSLIENALDTITIIDGEGTIRYESPSVERVLGYRPVDLLGHNVFEFVHPDDRPLVYKDFQELRADPGRVQTKELRFRHKDGSWRVLEVVGRNLLHDPAVEGVIINARDVTERKEAEAQLLHDAFHDKLTGLPNRALFMDRLSQSLKRGTRDGAPSHAVLFLDVDRFKLVNDSLGHPAGDRLLVDLAVRLEEAIRPGDTVARLGGDEFTILLDGVRSLRAAERVAERIHTKLQTPFHLDGRDLFVTASIGIATRTDEHTRAEDLLRDADLAMYRAKALGRDRHEVFDRTLHDEALATLQLETALRHALERDQLRVYFQPIVSLETGALAGFEALVRWRRKGRRLLSPRQFLPIAEETGLIVPIGRWVLERAVEELVHWNRYGAGDVHVAVNLSARQFAQPSLAGDVAAILAAHNAPPSLVQLELTESHVMDRPEEVLKTLEALRALGVGISIDDFGTGYSSLSRLRYLPVDVLKIDRAFVRHLDTDPQNASMVSAMVATATGSAGPRERLSSPLKPHTQDNVTGRPPR